MDDERNTTLDEPTLRSTRCGWSALRPARHLLLTAALAAAVSCGPEAPVADVPDADTAPTTADRAAEPGPGTRLDGAAPEEVRAARLPLIERAIQEDLSSARATITFERPLSPEDAEALLGRYAVRPNRANLLADGGSLGLISGTVALEETTGRDDELIERLRAGADDATRRGGTLLGVSAVVGEVEVARLRALQDDPEVFLVDLSAEPELRDDAEEDPGPDTARSDESAHDLGWRLWQSRHPPQGNGADVRPDTDAGAAPTSID